MDGGADFEGEYAMTDETIIMVVEGQKRGLPVPLELMERVYGEQTACWYALLACVSDKSALESAAVALRNGQSERVRVIISVMPSA